MNTKLPLNILKSKTSHKETSFKKGLFILRNKQATRNNIILNCLKKQNRPMIWGFKLIQAQKRHIRLSQKSWSADLKIILNFTLLKTKDSEMSLFWVKKKFLRRLSISSSKILCWGKNSSNSRSNSVFQWWKQTLRCNWGTLESSNWTIKSIKWSRLLNLRRRKFYLKKITWKEPKMIKKIDWKKTYKICCARKSKYKQNFVRLLVNAMSLKIQIINFKRNWTRYQLKFHSWNLKKKKTNLNSN